MSFKLGYPIKAKKSVFFFAKCHFLNLNKNKNDHFQNHRKTQKSRFLPSCFLLQKSSLQNQKSTFTVTFSPFLSLELHVFVLFRFPGRDTAFCPSASWPCLNFQHPDSIACWEIARIFDRVSLFIIARCLLILLSLQF